MPWGKQWQAFAAPAMVTQRSATDGIAHASSSGSLAMTCGGVVEEGYIVGGDKSYLK
jgi:hypothetical protein